MDFFRACICNSAFMAFLDSIPIYGRVWFLTMHLFQKQTLWDLICYISRCGFVYRHLQTITQMKDRATDPFLLAVDETHGVGRMDALHGRYSSVSLMSEPSTSNYCH
ncbi:hypothetical protein K469DRAFT_43130 [Zopfia rhizophila CBS 207.26]|uniref:Uncharacterized protein n=1 Tax=Zopfia rhizophila CBS 207.26 TaxID=1314779 RepID=A0A6A6EI80_9PEZI|nr:hypothetical protein K469DRAFT_43130 [Zopfia rhizophila CBS 207.26]